MEVDHPASPAPAGQHAPKTQATEEDELKDKFCDATSPVTVQFNEVTMAAYKIRGGIERTPCTVSTNTTIYCTRQTSSVTARGVPPATLQALP